MAWQTIIKPASPVTLWLLLLAGCEGDRSPLGPTQSGSNPSPSLATKAAGVQERGWVAYAMFVNFGASGCVDTYVTVVGSEGKAKHGPRAPTAQASASVSVSRYDWCTGLEEPVVQGSTSEGVLFRVNGTKATVRATIPAQGSPGKAIKVDMAWAVTGPVFSTSTGFRTKSRGTGQSEVSTTSHYLATASGTVSMNGAELAAGHTPAEYAYIDRYRTTSGPDTGSVSPVKESDPISAGSGGPFERYLQARATARFSSLDESGCVESFSTIEGFVGRQRGKDLADWSASGIDLFQIDHCTGTSGLRFSVFGGEGTSFQVNRQHTVARAQASIEDYAIGGGKIIHVDIDVGWTAGGFVRHWAFFERTKNDPDCRFTWLAKGSLRDATARGTVTVNGQNVSPEPALAATISYQTDVQRRSGGYCGDD